MDIVDKGWAIGILGYIIYLLAGWHLDHYFLHITPAQAPARQQGIVGGIIGAYFGWIWFVLSVGIADEIRIKGRSDMKSLIWRR